MASRREQLRDLARGVQERIQAAAASRLEAAAARVRGDGGAGSILGRAVEATRRAAAEGISRVAGAVGPAQPAQPAQPTQTAPPQPPAQPIAAKPARPTEPARAQPLARPAAPAEATRSAMRAQGTQEAQEAPAAQPAPPAPPAPPLPIDQSPEIERLLRQLSDLSTAANAIKQQLEQRGYGEAAKAVLGEREPPRETPGPPPPKPPPPPAPPEPIPEPQGPGKLGDDSPLLQGSSFYVPLMDRSTAFDVLWSEWIRAGIGNPRNQPAPGERDAMGRPAGRPASDEINYIPTVIAEIPGKEGGVVIPQDVIIDKKEFMKFANDWGISKVSFRVDGMVRASGPVARKSVYVVPEPGSDFDVDEDGS